jgi:hypothetical protein
MLVASITDEFILGLNVLRTHDASVDFGRRVLRLDDKKVSLCSSELRLHLSPYMNGKGDVVATQCRRVVAVRAEDIMETMESLVKTKFQYHPPTWIL